MRRIAALTITAALAFGAAACNGDDSVSTKPAKTPAAHTSSAKPAAKPSPTPSATKPAGVGDTISLKGSDPGASLDVTVVKVDDHAKATDYSELDKPTDRWVGIQFQLTNTGTAVYSDSPANGVQIADSQGQQFQASIVDISDGPSMSSDVRLTTGKKALGWIVFEVPKTSKLGTVQFSMDSGFADQAGEWQLTG